MTAHEDEGMLMQTVTPPVSVLPEKAPAELPAWPLGTALPAFSTGTREAPAAPKTAPAWPNSGLALEPIWQRALEHGEKTGRLENFKIFSFFRNL